MKKHSQRGAGASRRRGFALPIGLIMAVALAGVAGSYLTMTTSLRKVTLRNYSYHALQTVLEQGVDTAMYTLGQYRIGGYSNTTWTGWTSNGSGWSKDFGAGFDLGDGHHAGLKVTIQNVPTMAAGTDSSGKLLYPYIIVEAAYEPNDLNNTFKRQAVVVLKPTTSNSTTGGVGMTVAGNLTFGSNTAKIWFDSYTSAGNSAYGGSNRSASVTVATAGPAGDVSGSGTIYGYALVGSGDAANAFQKFNVYSSVDATSTDATRIASGYSGNFTVPADPSASTTTTSATIPDADQTISGSADATSPKYYYVDSFSLSGKSTLTISGNVVLIVPGTISLSGQSNIKLSNGGSLTIYAGGNVSMSGNGVMDGAADAPDSLMTNRFTLYGINTSSGGQSISLSGNAGFSGLIFAPNADVTFNGSGNSGVYYGSLTAKSATVNGKINFHYDQSLSSRQTAMPSSWASTNWVELHNTWTTDLTSSDKMVSMADYGLTP